MGTAAAESISIRKFLPTQRGDAACNPGIDEVAVEEPLEIRLLAYSRRKERAQQVRSRIAITMRTPGNDLELAAGFLFSESILNTPDEIVSSSTGANRVEIELSPRSPIDPARFQRHFYVSSSCGVCGKSSIDQVWEQARHCDRNGPGSPPFVAASLVADLPRRLRSEQAGFDRTGGLHASGLFSEEGDLLVVREDVGRHNALDKVIGRAFLDRKLPLDRSLLVLSGRVSFELMQKAAMAGIRVVIAVGAPSSLAVRIAQELDLTLVGFVREGRFNIYHGEWRIR